MIVHVAELIGIISANITTNSDAARCAMDQAQHKLAVEFGKRQGWKLSSRYFALAKLSSRPKRELDPRWSISSQRDSICMDHPFYFKDARGPVAVAAHLYNGEGKDPRIIALADQLGVEVSLHEDFPSWWYPGETRLVVYRRQAP